MNIGEREQACSREASLMSSLVSALRFRFVIAAVAGTHLSYDSCERKAGLMFDKHIELVYVGILQFEEFLDI